MAGFWERMDRLDRKAFGRLLGARRAERLLDVDGGRTLREWAGRRTGALRAVLALLLAGDLAMRRADGHGWAEAVGMTALAWLVPCAVGVALVRRWERRAAGAPEPGD